ncbi:MAG: hypothetical protein ACRDHP_16485, partial [Ktedonobacterales bacterium]
AIAAVLLIAVMAGTIFTLHSIAPARTPHQRPPVELRVFPQLPPCTPEGACSEESVCPVGAAWAPNDLRVALLNSCVRRGPTDPHVLVYDTQSGKRLLDVDLLSAIQRLPNLPVQGKNTPYCARGGAPSVWANALLWSRDGTQLEIPLIYSFYNGTLAGGDCAGFAGMLRMRPDGGSPQAYFHAYGADRGAISLPANDVCYEVWDLETGAFVAVPLDTSVAGQSFDCLTPALSYTWSANGALLPATPLPPAGTPATNTCPASGDPSGAASVTIWQPGDIERLTPPPPYEYSPALFAWATPYFVAASPDGRYVAFRLSLGGSITPPGLAAPDSAALAASYFNGYPPLPLQSAALAQRYGALPAGGMVSQAAAFRPDGRVVATGGYTIAASDGTNARYQSSPVVLYDCTSWHRLAALTPIADAASATPASGDSGQLLRWSPDGKYLLFVDSTYGAGTIWGPDSLPNQ